MEIIISSAGLQPDRPDIIISNLEVYSYYHKMKPKEVIPHLLEGEYVLIEDYYPDGLKVLRELKKELKKKHTGKSFRAQREYRKAYREASHHLLLMIADYDIVVKKSPEIGWLKKLYPDYSSFLIAYPEIQGMNSAWQWYLNGLEVEPLDLTIHPYYGIYFPTRFDHIELFDKWLQRYQGPKKQAIDIGIGSGILSFQLLQHGFEKVIGTDINKNAVIGCRQEAERLGFANRLEVVHGDLFDGIDTNTELIVFNPPWIKAKYQLEKGIDKAIYYQEGLFHRFFKEAKKHLAEDGRIIILFSNLAQVTGEDDIHPIKRELNMFPRFVKDRFEQQDVKAGSDKTRRKDFREREKVELWVLKHQD